MAELNRPAQETATAGPERAFAESFFSLSSVSSSVDNAWVKSVHDGAALVTIQRSVKDLDDNTSRTYVEKYLLCGEDLYSVGCQSLAKPVLLDHSLSGNATVVGFNLPLSNQIKSEGASYLEVGGLEGLHRIDCSSIHGKLQGLGGWFGGCSFSPDETKFVYVAALIKPTRGTLFSSIPSTSGFEKDTTSSKYDYEEDWGEKFVDVRDLGIFVLDLKTMSIGQVPGVDLANLTIGQPVFVSNSRLAYVGWRKTGRLLGMVYCYQRPCAVYVCDLISGVHTLASDGLALARSPRAAGRDHLAFLGHAEGFSAHNHAMQLYLYDCESGSRLLALDTLPLPIDGENYAGYAGLYADQLPRRVILHDRFILASAFFGAKEGMVLVDCQAIDPQRPHTVITWGSCLKLAVGENFEEASGCVVGTTDDGWVMGWVSTPSTPPRLVWAQIDKGGQLLCAKVLAIDKRISTTCKLAYAEEKSALHRLSVLRHKVVQLQADGVPFQATILFRADIVQGNCMLGVVLVPHGGPHSVTPHSFLPAYAALALSLGCAVVHVNYRGSVGFGDRSVCSLQGHIGSNDVRDMLQALNACMRISRSQLLSTESVYIQSDFSLEGGEFELCHSSVFDPTRISVVGGSHGGFLCAHLCCAYPSIFRATAMRNPVIDLTNMLQVTDIPDWCYAETLPGPLSAAEARELVDHTFPTQDHLCALAAASPASRLQSNYRTATLICLGRKDRRVPASQGVAFFHALRAHPFGACIPTRLLDFPDDTHALDLPQTELEHWSAIAAWLHAHLDLEHATLPYRLC